MNLPRPGRSTAGIGMTSQRTRARMVERLRDQGIADARVLEAMAGVPRHLFVGSARQPRLRGHRAADRLRPDHLAALCRRPNDRRFAQERNSERLEVGTGCGYQAAVLAQLAARCIRSSASASCWSARANLRELRLKNLRLAYGDGGAGLEKAAPFDSIILAAAAPEMPRALLQQLARGGRMILPLREGRADAQRLVLVERSRLGFSETALDPVRFVPLQAGKA
jgi:protein-L-isoaspartate(D-aspartate) O-methyltransferase